MTEMTSSHEVKSCCAAFYQNDVVRMLLGDVLHPGGLALTQHLGSAMQLTDADLVLDVACGRGQSAVHLTERFGCRVTGLDYGADNLAAAETLAIAKGVTELDSFRLGDAERLPLEDASFDAVISECSFCTFPDKSEAAAEMARVLRPGGRLGLTDMTVDGRLPEDVQTLLAWVSCVAGAGTSADYVAILQRAGFTDFVVEDRRQDLLDMTDQVKRKLVGVELVAKLGKLQLGELNLGEGKRLARQVEELILGGVIGYTLITATKG